MKWQIKKQKFKEESWLSANLSPELFMGSARCWASREISSVFWAVKWFYLYKVKIKVINLLGQYV